MVNIEIPQNYVASPSSIAGTPHLTINREATIDLDSSNAFEGPEKLLEVWFSPSPDALPLSAKPDGLKAVSAETWKEMLDLVNCKVLSVLDSEHLDAYLLSESSMFVFPHKLVLKTCGTTTLLCGLPRMLEIAALEAGFPRVEECMSNKDALVAATPYRVFYSRKNFQFPDQQRGPHRSWRDEVRFLDRLFLNGSAYMIGKMNGEHWYLYLTGPNTELTPPPSPDSFRANGAGETDTKVLSLPKRMATSAGAAGLMTDEAQDETLEILMTDLDEKNARQFYLDEASAVAEGRFYQKAREARKSAVSSLGVIPEDDGGANEQINGGNEHAKATTDGSDFDVFEQTSSDHSDMSPADEQDLTFPEELTTEGHTLGTVVSEHCGLADVYPTSRYPDARIDAYLFTPCGFSANGIVPAPATNDEAGGPTSDDTHYFTVHVTPEPLCSYASFETNVPARQTGRETADIVNQVVRIFKPGRFSVTLFEAKPEDGEVGGGGRHDGGAAAARPGGPTSTTPNAVGRKTSRMEHVEGYRRVDRIVHELDGYELVFRYYERNDWKGGAPRLGEVGF